MKQLLVLLLAFFSVTAYGQDGNNISGNGQVKKEKRNIPAFTGITNTGPANVTVVYGEGDLVVEGEENILPYVETEVVNGKLRIGFKKNWILRHKRDINVTVYATKLNYIGTSGSGSVSVDGKMNYADKFKMMVSGSGKLQASSNAFNTVETAISGSGSIALAGRADRLVSTISGSGGLRAKDLSADYVDARCSGSGSINVRANKEISGAISGSGSVLYTGDATIVNLRKSGSGQVKKV